MSVISSLRHILDPAPDPGSFEHEERLTVAALLVLVAHADGRVLPVETENLRILLAGRFGLSMPHADRVLRQAAEIESGMEPTTTLIERIVNDVPKGNRQSMLGLAYRIAAADGDIHEFEDDLIWRTGRLLGMSQEVLVEIKAAAVEAAGSGNG